MLLPELLFLLRGCSHFVSLNPLQKFPRQSGLTRMTLSMHCAQIKKLIHQRIAFVGLIQNRLQRTTKLA